MKRYLFVQTNPVTGMEDEYNRWYEDEHVPEVLKLPGFLAAQRMRVSDALRSADQSAYPFRYLSLYTVDLAPNDVFPALEEAGFRTPAALAPEREARIVEVISDTSQ